MQVHPTRSAVDLAVGGMITVGVSVLLQEPALMAWGGALLAGLAIARAVTIVGVSRVRAAGFEMLWRERRRLLRAGRGEVVEIGAEVRNRDSRAARYVRLRTIASPGLDVELDPTDGEVPAGGRLAVKVRVRTNRIGRHGIHGLSLEVRGSPGLFEVPLTFANPYGIEVVPRAYAVLHRSAQGGRSRMTADAGRAGPLSGDGYELRELREHQPGDPFKRIAWKASARRGQLVVRDYELEERDVVWLVLDASVELWAGAPGTAPLDIAIDEVASIADRHLARGDRVGLAVAGARLLAWIAPERGAIHRTKVMEALVTATDTIDADRSDLDEADVALRVLEHLRPLEPAAAARVRASEIDRVSRRADRVRHRGPFTPVEVHAPTKRERSLRRYLSAFGLGSPPRTEPERPKTDRVLASALERLVRERPRSSVVYVWSPVPAPASRPEIEQALLKHPRRRVDLRWIPMVHEPSISPEGSTIAPAVADAVRERVHVARARGEAELRRLGVRLERARRRSAGFLPTAGTRSNRARENSTAA